MSFVSAIYGTGIYGTSQYGIISIPTVIETPIITNVTYKYNKAIIDSVASPNVASVVSVSNIDAPIVQSTSNTDLVSVQDVLNANKPVIRRIDS